MIRDNSIIIRLRRVRIWCTGMVTTEVEMRYICSVFFIAGYLCAGNGNAYGDTDRPPGSLTPTDIKIVESSNRFGLELFKRVVESDDPNANVFISPWSVSYALAMTVSGADNETEDAMLSTLELSGISPDDINAAFKDLMPYLEQIDPAVAFAIANSIWYRTGLPIRDKFVETNRDYFGAEIHPLSSADVINAWVNEQTKGKISRIVNPPIDPQTIMFLINAIYFKGSWSTEFEKQKTRDRPFYLIDGSVIACRMMADTRDVQYFPHPEFQAARLPYGDSAFSMIVFLPNDTAGLPDLLNRLNDSTWNRWRNEFYITEVEFGLPRLKFEYDIELNDVLRAMGMGIAFESRRADFGRMVELERLSGENVFIDKVLHKTFLQVDEKGTEAAAVTSVAMGLTSAAPMEKPVMIVDHPFLFAIEEKASGSLLFIGKVMKPEWKE